MSSFLTVLGIDFLALAQDLAYPLAFIAIVAAVIITGYESGGMV